MWKTSFINKWPYPVYLMVVIIIHIWTSFPSHSIKRCSKLSEIIQFDEYFNWIWNPLWAYPPLDSSFWTRKALSTWSQTDIKSKYLSTWLTFRYLMCLSWGCVRGDPYVIFLSNNVIRTNIITSDKLDILFILGNNAEAKISV